MIPTVRMTAQGESEDIGHEDAIVIMPEDTMQDGFKVESIIITINDVQVMVSGPRGGGEVVDVLLAAKASYPR